MNDDRYSNGRYLGDHPQWHAERSPWKANHVVTGLQACALTPRSICDIGCGTGRALAHVVTALGGVERAVGFEPSPDAPVHPDAIGVIEHRRADATQAASSASAAERFEVAMMLDVFEHVPDYLGFLAACRPLADHFVFHIPLELNALTVATGRLGGSRTTLGHLHQFSRRTALDVLRDTGFVPLHDHYTCAGWDGPGRRPWSKMNLIRRPVHRISPRLAERLVGGLSLLVVARSDDG